MNILIKYKSTILGLLGGAIGSYAFYYFIGCFGGSCLISSNPYISTLYGAGLGSLFSSHGKKNKK